MNDLLKRRQNHKRSLIIIPHTGCSGVCKFCFLDKSQPCLPNWPLLQEELLKILVTPEDYTSIYIMGGELFEDRFLSSDYTNNLESLVANCSLLKAPTCIVSMPISLENISTKAIQLIRRFKELYSVRLTTSFSEYRFKSKQSSNKFFKNLEQLKNVISSVSITIFRGEEIDPRIIKSGLTYFIEEPIILDSELCTSYSNFSLDSEAVDSDIHCLCHCTDILTSQGIKTCAGITRKPSWISELEWTRLCTDKDYLKIGYQMVTDWYGCSDCQKQATCPGMCWISYYAQRDLYNNRKCLYK